MHHAGKWISNSRLVTGTNPRPWKNIANWHVLLGFSHVLTFLLFLLKIGFYIIHFVYTSPLPVIPSYPNLHSFSHIRNKISISKFCLLSLKLLCNILSIIVRPRPPSYIINDGKNTHISNSSSSSILASPMPCFKKDQTKYELRSHLGYLVKIKSNKKTN